MGILPVFSVMTLRCDSHVSAGDRIPRKPPHVDRKNRVISEYPVIGDPLGNELKQWCVISGYCMYIYALYMNAREVHIDQTLPLGRIVNPSMDHPKD